MIRSKFKQRLSDDFAFSEANPMDGVSNMSDAMLVLAVGIMLALVINWKIDIKYTENKTQTMEEVSKEELMEIEYEMLEKSDVIENIESNSEYKQSGKVYTDLKSGKTYVIMDEE